MSSVGSYLRELRERRGLSLDEISRSTRVLHQYLESLEADDLAALPAPAFTRGFIRAYCQVLREPPDEALARYQEGVQPHALHGHDAALPESRKSRELGTRRENRGRGAVLVSFVLLVVLGVAQRGGQGAESRALVGATVGRSGVGAETAGAAHLHPRWCDRRRCVTLSARRPHDGGDVDASAHRGWTDERGEHPGRRGPRVDLERAVRPQHR